MESCAPQRGVVMDVEVYRGTVYTPDCTQTQRSTPSAQTAGEAVQSACGPMMQAVQSGTTFDPKAFCDSSACLSALDGALKVMPDCVAQGINLKKTYDDLIDKIHTQCKKVVSSAPAALVGAPVAAVAAIAVVAVVVQL